MTGTNKPIVQLCPAESGYRALLWHAENNEYEIIPITMWALVRDMQQLHGTLLLPVLRAYMEPLVWDSDCQKSSGCDDIFLLEIINPGEDPKCVDDVLEGIPAQKYKQGVLNSII